MDNIQIYIGQTIVKIRREKKISQESLALTANIDRHYMSDIENGRRNISVEFLEKIAQALGTKGSTILSEAESIIEQQKEIH